MVGRDTALERDARSQCLLTSEAYRWNIDLSWRAVVEVDSDH
jgi:hypothetical protein